MKTSTFFTYNLKTKEYTERKCYIGYNFFTRCYDSFLLGSEFNNIYGTGSTIENTIISLKIRINQLTTKN